MLYKILADGVVLIHFLWILFLCFGLFWGVKSNPIKILHLSGLTFAIILQIFGWYCPLTDLEIWLRSRQDPSFTYQGSFIIYYVEKIVYLEISRSFILFLTILICALSIWLYLPIKPGRKRAI